MYFLKSRQRIVGVIILILCYGYITNRLVQFQNWHEFKELVSGSPWWITKLLFAQIGLAIINLLIESKKWQVLLSCIKKVNIWQSYKMVLAGFSSGIFTPAKIGEPIGRLLALPKAYWGQGVVLNYFGGIIHNLVIFIVGLTCTAILWIQTDHQPYQKVILYAISIMTFLLLVSFSIWYFRAHFRAILKRFQLHNKLTNILSILKSISIIKGLWIFLLSLIRFSIYSIQLFLFFWAFGSESIGISFLLMIPVYFMVITLIPSFLLADIGVRSSVALLLFSALSFSEPIILLSVFMIWIINQVIPAIGGSLLLYKQTKHKQSVNKTLTSIH